MKYFFVGSLGFLIGAAAAGAALYFNPLTETSAPTPSTTDRALHYVLPDQVLGFALGEHALLPGGPTRDNGLWEETIDRSALLALVLEDAADRPVAVASRLMAGSDSTDLLLNGVLLHDYWLLTVPDEGTLFVRADSNLWPFLKQTVPVWYFGRPWHGPTEYRPTAGPGVEGTAVVVGATGRFKGLEGSAIEQYRVTDLDPTSSTAAAVGELHLHFTDAPAVATAQK